MNNPNSLIVSLNNSLLNLDDFTYILYMYLMLFFHRLQFDEHLVLEGFWASMGQQIQVEKN